MDAIAPIRRLRARRELAAARRAADRELLETQLPPPRLAWRTNELCSRRAPARARGDARRRRPLVGEPVPARSVAAEPRRRPRRHRPPAADRVDPRRPEPPRLAARRPPRRATADGRRRPALLARRRGSAPPRPRRGVRRARGRAVTSLRGETRPRVKRLVVGRPLATDELDETLLPKWLALPIFASDPLSSVAYATEAALVVLLAASAGAAHLVFPLSLAIAALLAIVVASYRQTVRAYETSGGAYVVAKDNLGTLPSLVAAAALLTDYVLTVAVSVAAGILALTSAVPSLRGHEVALSLACIAFITFANLRGVREAGMLFALPTYAFVDVDLPPAGDRRSARCAVGSCPEATVSHPAATGVGSGHAVRPPARVRVGVDRADRRRGDRERRQRVPAAARAERRDDARRPRRRSRSRCSSASRGSPSRRTPGRRTTGSPSVLSRDRPRRLPAGSSGPASCTGSCRGSRSRSSSSLPTRRSRAFRVSPRCSRATRSSRASSRTSATGSSSRTASSCSPRSRRSSSGSTRRASSR